MSSYPEILLSSRFYLELSLNGSDRSVDGVFMECGGFKCSQEVIEVCEVTPEQWGLANKGRVRRIKLPGNAKTDNITLRRGLMCSTVAWNWFEEIQQGNWAGLFHSKK